MAELWYKKLGFYNNPFSIKPAAYHDNLIAYDMDYIHEKIENAELVFIEGDYGSGKTTILKSIINKFRGKNKIIYYSFNTGGEFNLKALLDGANTFMRKLAGLKVKNIIMLLDEVHTMNTNDVKSLLKQYTKGTIKSIVFVSHDYNLVKFPQEATALLNGNILKTVNLTNDEAIELVRKRIGDLQILSDETILQIFKLANRNPRRLLEYCEDVARFTVEMGDETAEEFHLKEVLGDAFKATKPKKAKKTKKAAKKPAAKKAKPKKKKAEPKPPVEKEIKAEEPKVELKEEKKVEPAPKEDITVTPLMEPEIEIKSLEETPEELASERKEEKANNKKFKVNKLVVDSKSNPLGTVTENNEPTTNGDDIPEYNVFVFDD